MSFDAQAETANILTALKALAGGRVYQSLPLDESIPRNADGTCKPYIVLISGTPVSAASGRGIAGGERVQPQNMMWTVNSVAADADSAGKLRAAALNILLGFSPNGSNATELKTFGGFNYTNQATQMAPARETFSFSCSCVLNLET